LGVWGRGAGEPPERLEFTARLLLDLRDQLHPLQPMVKVSVLTQ
jgi:hypothetical protein